MRSRPVLSSLSLFLPAFVGLTLAPAVAQADEPLLERYTYGSKADFFATGGALAIDGPDADTTKVDTLVHPGTTTINDGEIPEGAVLRKAFLYWGGSVVNTDCADPNGLDDAVTFTPPGEASVSVTAESCYCSDAAAQSYDMQLCRADVTNLIGALSGDYTVDDFDALIENGTTNAASFSIVLVYGHPDLPARRIALYDGLRTMWSSNPDSSVTITLDGLVVDDPAVGDLTWYAIEGDVGGDGDENVTVEGQPGGQVELLFDADNPANNPMNHTITTTTPAQLDVLGVDIDVFSIDDALAPGDDSVETIYTAGSDKYWLAYNIVGVNVFAPDFNGDSSKTWFLEDDADEDGAPSPGDTIRYTITFTNQGNAPGTVEVNDPIPPQASAWNPVDVGGGVDLSTEDTLIVEAITVPVDESRAVIFDMVLDDVPDGTQIFNTASWSAEPNGGEGQLNAPPVVVGDPGMGETGEESGEESGSEESGEESGSEESGSGESGSGTGESETTEGSGDGESGSDGGSSEDGVGDEVGETSPADGGAPPLEEEGCNCAATPERGRGRGALVLLAFLGLSLGRGRRARIRRARP